MPEGVIFRSKPNIALCLMDLSQEWEVPCEVVVADSGYGRYPRFLGGLEELKVSYVCGVESTFGVRLPEEVRAAKEAGAAPPYKGTGQPPKERAAPLYTARELIGSLPEETWRTVSWREGTKGTLSKQMVALRAHRATGSPRRMSTTQERVLTAAEGWLIAERSLLQTEGKEPAEEELKYYYSSLGADVSLERLAALAHSRWAIEQFYEDAKGECGLGDYQGRRWDGLHRHLGLVMVAYSFLILHSSVNNGTEDTSGEPFFPHGAAHHASGYPPTGTGEVARRSGGVVRRNREDQDLPSTQKLTK